MRNSYHAEHRRIHSGKRDQTCPDCGRENCMTKGEIAKGYHCGQCTRDIEGYQEPSFNEDIGCMEY